MTGFYMLFNMFLNGHMMDRILFLLRQISPRLSFSIGEVFLFLNP